MAKEKNAAGLTNDIPFYGRPDLETFKERVEIAVKTQLEAIEKNVKIENIFKSKLQTREEIESFFALLRLGPPEFNKVHKYVAIYLEAQDTVIKAGQAKRKAEEEAKRKAEEEAREKREREEARAAKRKAKEEEKARKTREEEEKKRKKEIERGRQLKRKPSWLYWLIREQNAKEREHEIYQNASRAALALGKAIRRIQKELNAFIGPILDELAKLKTATARLIWSNEPWTPQDRTRYNWGKKKELEELLEESPDGTAEQDPEQAAKDAKRKKKARQINHAKAINKVLDKVLDELAEDEQNVVRSSLEISAEKVAKEIQQELDSRRQAIDADKENETRIADAKDLTNKGNPRRTAPEKSIPKSMPQLGTYGESVIFEAPSPDQIKAVLNAQYDGEDFSGRIWKERDKLAQELKSMMEAAIINGENSASVARKLAQKMGVAYSHAERLVRTEMNRILNDVSFNEMKAAGAESYMWVAIEDGRTCGRCKKKNRKIFKVSDKKIGLNAPPLHPYCRCTIVARFAWEDEDGGSAKETLSEIEKELKQLQKELEEEAKAPKPQKKEPGYFEQVPNSKITEEARQWMIETGLLYVADDGKTKAKKAITKANIEAAAQAQDDAMKSDEQRIKTAIGIQKRAIAQGKPPKANTKISGAINTDPKTREEQKELDALAENLYEQQRRAKNDVKRIAQSTGWPEERIAKIKDYIFNQKHEIYPGEPPERFSASMGMIQSWRRMAKGDPKAIEKHDILLLQHEWLEMEIKTQNPGIEHQKAHDMANKVYCYSKAEEAYNAKSKRLSISERTRRKGSLLPRKQ